MSVEYLSSAVAWSLAGYIVGYTVALAHVVDQTARTISEDPMPDQQPDRRRVPSPSNGVIGWLVVLMSIITVATLAYSNHQQRAVLDCQAAVNGRVVGAIKERAHIADDDRHAINQLVLSIAKGSVASSRAFAAIQEASQGVVDAGASRASLDHLTETIARFYSNAGTDQTQSTALDDFVATIKQSERARAQVNLPGPKDYECGR